MDAVEEKETLNEFALFDDPDWGDEASEWDDDDIDWGESEYSDEIFYNQTSQASQTSSLYSLEGYGDIYDLDQLHYSDGLIEILEHANGMEQFNYILGMSYKESHDDKLLQYLIAKDYTIEQYCSISVSHGIFNFEPLFMYMFNKASEEEKRELTSKVQFMNEEIAEFLKMQVINIKGTIDWDTSMRLHLKDEMVSQRVLDYYKNNPEEVNFNFVNVCKLDTEMIRDLLQMGYVIDRSSSYEITNNDVIMKEEFLKKVKIQNPAFFERLDKSVLGNNGAYSKLFFIKEREFFSDSILSTLGIDFFFQILKYILLSDYEIDLSSIIRDGKLELLKLIYDNLNDLEGFNIELFINIISIYNLNKKLMNGIDKEMLENYKEEFMFLINHKDIKVSSIDELKNVRNNYFKQMNQKIDKANTEIELKNIITCILTNQTYMETKKGECEIWDDDKLKTLKNSLKDEKVKKDLDSYIIFSRFFKDLDNIHDISLLKGLAMTVSKKISEKGFNSKWLDINNKVMAVYNYELNERMTDFNKYMTGQMVTATDYAFNDGTNVMGTNVEIAHIKSGEEFNSLIHVLNAYEKVSIDGVVEAIKNPVLIGQSYLCATGISDEYNRICVNGGSYSNPKYNLKILYSHVPKGDLLYASNRDTGIDSTNNSREVSARLPKNMLPFRRLVRNTEVHGSETYNEIDIYRDNLKPSGIAFMGDYPLEEEINVAAYLGVPLVKIDDLQQTFKKDILLSRPSDSEFYHIKEHQYEDEDITVTSNDSFDEMLNVLHDEVIDKESQSISYLDVIQSKDEVGRFDYTLAIGDDEYEATPLYHYVDSSRVNISAIDIEEYLVQSNLASYLGVDIGIKFDYCKYPNGDVVLSALEKEGLSTGLDECIKYLVTGKEFDFESISECYDKLNGLSTITDEEYLSFFDSLLLVSDYTETMNFQQKVLDRKNKILSLMITSELQDELDVEIPKLKEVKEETSNISLL